MARFYSDGVTVPQAGDTVNGSLVHPAYPAGTFSGKKVTAVLSPEPPAGIPNVRVQVGVNSAGLPANSEDLTKV
jgi:hypothetical protein